MQIPHIPLQNINIYYIEIIPNTVNYSGTTVDFKAAQFQIQA